MMKQWGPAELAQAEQSIANGKRMVRLMVDNHLVALGVCRDRSIPRESAIATLIEVYAQAPQRDICYLLALAVDMLASGKDTLEGEGNGSDPV